MSPTAPSGMRHSLPAPQGSTTSTVMGTGGQSLPSQIMESWNIRTILAGKSLREHQVQTFPGTAKSLNPQAAQPGAVNPSRALGISCFSHPISPRQGYPILDHIPSGISTSLWPKKGKICFSAENEIGNIPLIAHIPPRQFINCGNWAESREFSSKLEARLHFPAQRTGARWSGNVVMD